MNFLRKSTNGFSICNILLDFSGGIANYGQMVLQSIDQGLSSPHLCYISCHLIIYLTLTYFKSHLSRFMGQLLWEYRKSVAISGMGNSWGLFDFFLTLIVVSYFSFPYIFHAVVVLVLTLVLFLMIILIFEFYYYVFWSTKWIFVTLFFM